ncbi:hypothetical protein [Paenibacillus sp. IITD108]|uniref:hypothetical protein n=1 Tax=Paenibacillus sp. IITD108 TaxID=3116649 RepID=UPI002F42CE38
MTDIEKSYQSWCEREEELKKLVADLEKNEASTRFHIIDEIFVQILGWNKKSIEVEFSVGSSAEDEAHKKLFADYKIESNYNNFLIEAKRIGRFFTLPTSSTRKYTSDGVIKKSLNNASFIEQSEKYMRNLGIPFCVLTNGFQFMIIRQKVLKNQKDIIVFRSFDDIKNNFITFWSILSPFSNGVEYLDKLLSTPEEIRTRPQYEKNIRSQILKKDEQVSTGNIRATTERYLRRYFSELTLENQKQLLKDCYCDPSGRFTVFAETLKNEILPKELSYIKKVTISNYFNEEGNFRNQYIENFDEEVGTVFVLVGGVGAGKSTFVKYFYEHELDTITKQRLVWVSIDLLDFSRQIDELNDFLTEKIFESLKTNYKHFELEAWDTSKIMYQDIVDETTKGMPPFMRSDQNSIDSEIYRRITIEKQNKEDYLKRVFHYLKNNLNIRPCFVFDNVDQKPSAWQEEVLLLAFNRATIFNAVVISSLRLENYFSLKDKPAFDSIEPNVFRIEPPGVKELLKKRIAAFKQYPQGEFSVEIPPNIKMSVPLEKFISVLDNTLDSPSHGKQVEAMLENLSGGNMRRALNLFKTFIQSGNTKLYELLNQYRRIDNVEVDYNYVFDSLILKDNVHYNSSDSEFFNVFNYYNDGFYSHMTVVNILKYLDRLSYNEKNSFVSIDDLIEKFKDSLIDRDKLLNILEPLLSSYLINSNYGERSRLVLTTSVSISLLGKYYINDLITDWRYLYYVCTDTPITDVQVLKTMKRIYEAVLRTKNTLALFGLKRQLIDTFMEYLKDCENADIEFMRKLTHKQVQGCFDELQANYRHNIELHVKSINN